MGVKVFVIVTFACQIHSNMGGCSTFMPVTMSEKPRDG